MHSSTARFVVGCNSVDAFTSLRACVRQNNLLGDARVPVDVVLRVDIIVPTAPKSLPPQQTKEERAPQLSRGDSDSICSVSCEVGGRGDSSIRRFQNPSAPPRSKCTPTPMERFRRPMADTFVLGADQCC